jgi:hypothetical protein
MPDEFRYIKLIGEAIIILIIALLGGFIPVREKK